MPARHDTWPLDLEGELLRLLLSHLGKGEETHSIRGGEDGVRSVQEFRNNLVSFDYGIVPWCPPFDAPSEQEGEQSGRVGRREPKENGKARQLRQSQSSSSLLCSTKEKGHALGSLEQTQELCRILRVVKSDRLSCCRRGEDESCERVGESHCE